MKPFLFLLMIFLLGGCKMSTFYPLAGATVGGGTGALGGPVTAGVGAGLGYSMGELARAEDSDPELKKNIQTIKALSEGDVKKILDSQMKEEGGFFDMVLDEVWGILKLTAIALALYLIVPIIYTRYLHKKNERNK